MTRRDILRLEGTQACTYVIKIACRRSLEVFKRFIDELII